MQADSSRCDRLLTDRCKDKGPRGGADDGAWPPPGPGDALCAARHGSPSLRQGWVFRKRWHRPDAQWAWATQTPGAPPRGKAEGLCPPSRSPTSPPAHGRPSSPEAPLPWGTFRIVLGCSWAPVSPTCPTTQPSMAPAPRTCPREARGPGEGGSRLQDLPCPKAGKSRLSSPVRRGAGSGVVGAHRRPSLLQPPPGPAPGAAAAQRGSPAAGTPMPSALLPVWPRHLTVPLRARGGDPG